MTQPPHPTAGANGEGPPVCPPKWKWRCGNRLRDMYFYSPEGKLFRSRTELASHLSKLPDGPAPEDFCWRVTQEILKTGVWTKEESSPKSAKTPKGKVEIANAESPAKRLRQGDVVRNGPSQISSPAKGGVQFSQVEPLAIRAPGPVVSKKVTPGTSRPDVRATKLETPKKSETPKKAETSLHTFKEILAEPSSFKWLFDPVAMEKFKEEAQKLSDLSSEEIGEMRKLLVDRNPQMGNMSKYPNAALKVFLRLLGTDGLSDEPSDSLGKVELADLCVKLAKATMPQDGRPSISAVG